MIKLNREEILRRTKGLPLDLNQTVQSERVIEELKTITKNHNLHVDQIGAVADLLELTLAGVVLTREFVSMLGEALPDLPQEKVLAIAEEINRKIFSPVRSSLQKVEETALQSEQNSQTPISPKMTEQTIETIKTSVPTVSVNTSKDISYENRDTRLKMIPNDVKTRINNDPYKEPIG